MKRAAFCLVMLLIPLVTVLCSVQIFVYCDTFFAGQYEANWVAENTKIKSEDLMRITDEIQAYLSGQRKDFIIYGTVDGKYRQVFNEREIMHMKDVQSLFKAGFILRNLSAVLLLLLVLYLWLTEKKLLFKAMLASFLFSAAVFLALAVLLYLDFNRCFVVFHEVLFNNDLWILAPESSILVNMVPEPFFVAIAWHIVLSSFLILAVIGFAGFLGISKTGKKSPA